MLTETELFFGYVCDEDRSVLDLLDADYTFLNEPLARHYGIEGRRRDRVPPRQARPIAAAAACSRRPAC